MSNSLKVNYKQDVGSINPAFLEDVLEVGKFMRLKLVILSYEYILRDNSPDTLILIL
jgi:hypothetical protein